MGEWGNFWQLGKLGQVWENMKGMGKCVGMWGQKEVWKNVLGEEWGSVFGVWGEVWEMCWGEECVCVGGGCVEEFLGCGKCVGVEGM